MKKAMILSIGVVLVASAALASNTGFKLNYTLDKITGKSGNNWVGVPYFYFPDGDPTNPNPQGGLVFCNDMNEALGDPSKKGSKVSLIWRFDTSKDRPISQSCTGTFDSWTMKKGEGYQFTTVLDKNIVNIVGSHDDTHAKNKVVAPATPTLVVLDKKVGKSGNNWISVPYHSKADTALQICNDLNDVANLDATSDPARGTKVSLVWRFDTSKDRPVSNSCTGTFSAFTPKVGEGLQATAAADATGVSFQVY